MNDHEAYEAGVCKISNGLKVIDFGNPEISGHNKILSTLWFILESSHIDYASF